MATKRVSWYNGFSWEQREATEDILKKAFYGGSYTPVPVCELCKLRGIIKARDVSPCLMFHCEDYSRPFEATIICVECHLRLHGRFAMPNRWRRHLLAIRRAPAQAFPSWAACWGMARRDGRHDIGEVALEPKPGRWWERLSYDPALKAPAEEGVAIVLTYGPSNDIHSLTVTVVRDEALVAQPRLI